MNGNDSTSRRRFSPGKKSTWIVGTGVASAVAVLAGSGVAVAATMSPSSSAASAAPTPSPSPSDGQPRSGPADGGATGIIESTSASGFSIQTWTGVDVTVDRTSSTKVRGGPARDLRAGTSVLVLGLVNAGTSTTTTTTITAAEVDVQPHGDGGATVGKRDGVLPADPGTPGPDKSVGTIPSDYTQGEGTIVSGAQAYAAVRAAQAVFPGGVVDRVVELSAGNYEAHDIGVLWPHHVFETEHFKVTGAND
ncbi:MAG TPA: hypothetical protein VGG54_27290 [Trebonia sp.]|jgi:hypothetical protein